MILQPTSKHWDFVYLCGRDGNCESKKVKRIIKKEEHVFKHH